MMEVRTETVVYILGMPWPYIGGFLIGVAVPFLNGWLRKR